jgi:hypothetical protein
MNINEVDPVEIARVAIGLSKLVDEGYDFRLMIDRKNFAATRPKNLSSFPPEIVLWIRDNQRVIKAILIQAADDRRAQLNEPAPICSYFDSDCKDVGNPYICWAAPIKSNLDGPADGSCPMIKIHPPPGCSAG